MLKIKNFSVDIFSMAYELSKYKIPTLEEIINMAFKQSYDFTIAIGNKNG